MSVCDKNCFECRFPDCICDEMDAEDWRATREMDEYAIPKTAKQEKIAAYHKAYYEANREAIAAKKKARRCQKKVRKETGA